MTTEGKISAVKPLWFEVCGLEEFELIDPSFTGLDLHYFLNSGSESKEFMGRDTY